MLHSRRWDGSSFSSRTPSSGRERGLLHRGLPVEQSVSQCRRLHLPQPYNSHSRSSSSLHVKYQRLIPPIDVSMWLSFLPPRCASPQKLTPPTGSQIEILPAGEEGPRRLDSSTVMMVGRVPFLTVTEFIRAKVKAWSMCVSPLHWNALPSAYRVPFVFGRRGLERDAQDVTYGMTRHWSRVDLNRIPEQEMNDFARRFPAVAPSWQELKRKYGL